MAREGRTIEAMISIYCRAEHDTQGMLCSECAELLDYARSRLDRCPFQEGKPTCVNCHVHCSKPTMREEIRIVMRFAGPRMVYKHPVLTLFHLVDGLRKEPVGDRKVARW